MTKLIVAKIIVAKTNHIKFKIHNLDMSKINMVKLTMNKINKAKLTNE